MENIEYFNSLLLPKEGRRAASPAKPLRKVYAVGIASFMLLLGLLTGFVLAKHRNFQDELATRAREVAAGPFVQTAVAVRGGQERVIKELGETRPYAFVTLYAKVSGYLKEVLVDKGDKVKKGQRLATIQSPETMSQYQAAVADSKNKRALSRRMVQLHREATVSDEERDQAVAAADMAEARQNELSAREGYTAILAPFDGTVTARFADAGALVQDAANAQSGALPIVTVSQIEKLRITIFINQRDAALVQVGDPAVITLPERPDVQYEARVTRKSGELDTRSRTMLTEIEIDNTKNEILSGGFVDVKLLVKTPSFIQIPSQALVMKGTQSYVSVIGNDDIVHYRPIQIGDNDGTSVNVRSGLEEGETVILNMGNSLTEGTHVQRDNN